MKGTMGCERGVSASTLLDFFNQLQVTLDPSREAVGLATWFYSAADNHTTFGALSCNYHPIASRTETGKRPTNIDCQLFDCADSGLTKMLD